MYARHFNIDKIITEMKSLSEYPVVVPSNFYQCIYLTIIISVYLCIWLMYNMNIMNNVKLTLDQKYHIIVKVISCWSNLNIQKDVSWILQVD